MKRIALGPLADGVELIERGEGRPLLFLHPVIGLDPKLPVLDRLAQFSRVLAPSHPGFGRTERPDAIGCVDDIAYLYLELMDKLDLRDVVVVGVSFGAWIAAALAVKSCERVSHLVLADPVGIKIGPRDKGDIADMFMLSGPEFDALAYANPAAMAADPQSWSDEETKIAVRNWESAAFFGWIPYMYDPRLHERLYRINVPTLLLWGEQDRVISRDYVSGYADLIAGSTFDTIADAGHYPHVEQPGIFADRIAAFVGEGE